MSTSFLKKVAGFTAVLLILLVFYLYRQIPHAHSPFASGVDAAQKITFKAAAQNAVLSRKGTSWEVLEPNRPPHTADETKIGILLSALKNLQIEAVISDRPERQTDYQVDEASGLRLTLTSDSGKVLADGIFGKPAPDFSHSYFRYPDEPLVYLARGVLPGDLGKAESAYWIAADTTTKRSPAPSAFKTK